MASRADETNGPLEDDSYVPEETGTSSSLTEEDQPYLWIAVLTVNTLTGKSRMDDLNEEVQSLRRKEEPQGTRVVKQVVYHSQITHKQLNSDLIN